MEEIAHTYHSTSELLDSYFELSFSGQFCVFSYRYIKTTMTAKIHGGVPLRYELCTSKFQPVKSNMNTP